ncbi:MAG: hypothetical protein AB7G39_03840 [Alphaproteobacteria bacterium]
MQIRRAFATAGRDVLPQIALCGLLALTAAPAWAADEHGHDHGGGRAQIVVSPRTEARIGDRQLVLVYARGRLVAFLESFANGAPVRGAEMEATVNFQAEPLPEVAPGIYRSGDIALPGGSNEIEIAWRAAGEDGTATLTLQIPSGAATAGGLDNLPVPKVPGWVFLAAALLLYAGVTLLFWRRAVLRRRVPEDVPAHPDPHRHQAAE